MEAIVALIQIRVKITHVESAQLDLFSMNLRVHVIFYYSQNLAFLIDTIPP